MKPRHRGIATAVLLATWAAAARAGDADLPSPERLAAVREYIKRGWTTLTRSNGDLLRAAPDGPVA